MNTNTGDTEIIKYLRQAFENCEQIATDNPTDMHVARLVTDLHDVFDKWMRQEDAHENLGSVLLAWRDASEDYSGIGY
jgi:hypothetical protein